MSKRKNQVRSFTSSGLVEDCLDWIQEALYLKNKNQTLGPMVRLTLKTLTRSEEFPFHHCHELCERGEELISRWEDLDELTANVERLKAGERIVGEEKIEKLKSGEIYGK